MTLEAFMGNLDIPTAEHVLDFLEQQSTLDWLIPMSFDASVLAGQALIEAKDILREIIGEDPPDEYPAEYLAEYLTQIRAWNWGQIVRDAFTNVERNPFDGELSGSVFLGRIEDLYPDGDGTTDRDFAYEDALLQVAGEHGLWIRSDIDTGIEVVLVIEEVGKELRE